VVHTVQLQTRPMKVECTRDERYTKESVETDQDQELQREVSPEVGSKVGPTAHSADNVELFVDTMEPDETCDYDLDSDGDEFFDSITVDDD
jgi:hypothetical protein